MIRILFTVSYVITTLLLGFFVKKEPGWWLFQLGVLGVIHLVWWIVLIIKRKRKSDVSVDKHRLGLIDLYEDQIQDAGTFMSIVLVEAIRKLKETQLDSKKIENWVVKLEKSWRSL